MLLEVTSADADVSSAGWDVSAAVMDRPVATTGGPIDGPEFAAAGVGSCSASLGPSSNQPEGRFVLSERYSTAKDARSVRPEVCSAADPGKRVVAWWGMVVFEMNLESLPV